MSLKKVYQTKKFAALLIGALLISILSSPSFAQLNDDPVAFALSAREMTVSAAQLEQLAGGEDALVAKLLELRTSEKPPFAGIRAEKLLLSYAARADVRAALESDLNSETYKGLARVIAVNLDSVQDAETRRGLAKVVLGRAAKDAEFSRYAKSLTESQDEEIKKMAKEAVGK